MDTGILTDGQTYLSIILAGLVVVVIGYLLGSISFSIVFTRLFIKEDIRSFGSGNAGATNVARSVGKGPAALTFLFDFLKCVVSVILGYYIFLFLSYYFQIPDTMAQIGKYAGGIGCILGHIYPLYFGFKGGKAVVSMAALICLIDWRVFIPTFLTFCIIFAVKKIVSLASIIGVSIYPVYTFIIMFVFDYIDGPLGGNASMQYIVVSTIAAAVLGGIIVFAHRENIGRLRRGEEKKFSFSSKSDNK